MNFLPQKHKEGLRVNYNSGFFITTNVYPDFGNEIDNEAIRKRLDVFQTSSLKRKDPSVEGELIIDHIYNRHIHQNIKPLFAPSQSAK